ncbi:MAG: DUF6294 family protein [Pseudonocardiaceae bacterium]
MPNAHWTLDSEGNAYFDGVVTSSDDNDAWLMWLHLKDYNNGELVSTNGMFFTSGSGCSPTVAGSLVRGSALYR